MNTQEFVEFLQDLLDDVCDDEGMNTLVQASVRILGGKSLRITLHDGTAFRIDVTPFEGRYGERLKAR